MGDFSTLYPSPRHKLIGRIDEVQDDVKQIRRLIDANLSELTKKLLAKNTKDRSHCIISKSILK